MTRTNTKKHDRYSIRLKGYDYRLSGAYFVTITSWQRECLFGEVVEGRMRLNFAGDIVYSEWQKLANHFPHARTETFIVMPNHVHGIIIIENESTVGATRLMVNGTVDRRSTMAKQMKNRDNGSPLPRITRRNGPLPGSLGAIIGQFKSRATKRIWAIPGIELHPIWQRNYYEHIIRDNQEYQLISQYIKTNPLQGDEDEYSTYYA